MIIYSSSPTTTTNFFLNLDNLDDATVIPRNGDKYAIDVNNVTPQDNPIEEAFDTLLNAEVLMNVGDEHTLGTVTKRAWGADDRPIGRRDDNLLLETRMDGIGCQTYPLINSHITS